MCPPQERTIDDNRSDLCSIAPSISSWLIMWQQLFMQNETNGTMYCNVRHAYSQVLELGWCIAGSSYHRGSYQERCQNSCEMTRSKMPSKHNRCLTWMTDVKNYLHMHISNNHTQAQLSHWNDRLLPRQSSTSAATDHIKNNHTSECS